jgi:hypothetical protein
VPTALSALSSQQCSSMTAGLTPRRPSLPRAGTKAACFDGSDETCLVSIAAKMALWLLCVESRDSIVRWFQG